MVKFFGVRHDFFYGLLDIFLLRRDLSESSQIFVGGRGFFRSLASFYFGSVTQNLVRFFQARREFRSCLESSQIFSFWSKIFGSLGRAFQIQLDIFLAPTRYRFFHNWVALEVFYLRRNFRDSGPIFTLLVIFFRADEILNLAGFFRERFKIFVTLTVGQIFSDT